MRALREQQVLAVDDRRRFEERSAHEKRCWEKGFRFVCGVDEAGRGPLAGPVVAGAVILGRGSYIPGLDDSKKLSPRGRERIYNALLAEAIAVSWGLASVEEIDTHNIYRATVMAMRRAIEGLGVSPDFVILDAVRLPGLSAPQLPVVHGDALCNCVAAASIIAKVTRDRIMDEIDLEFPEYGFRRNRGYATPEHLRALERFGPCPHHRKTFHWRSSQEVLPGFGRNGCAGARGGEGRT